MFFASTMALERRCLSEATILGRYSVFADRAREGDEGWQPASRRPLLPGVEARDGLVVGRQVEDAAECDRVRPE